MDIFYLGLLAVGPHNSYAQSLAAQQGLQTIALAGMQAPGTPTGATYLFLGTPSINNLDQVAFASGLAGNVSPPNNSGIWSTGGGALHVVVRGGDPAPGFPAGTNFSMINTTAEVSLSNGGATEFWNTVSTQAFNTGIWTDNAGAGLQAVAVTGTPAPSLGAETNLGYVNGFAFSGSGIAAFDTTLTGTGVTGDNDRSIWSGTCSFACACRS